MPWEAPDQCNSLWSRSFPWVEIYLHKWCFQMLYIWDGVAIAECLWWNLLIPMFGELSLTSSPPLQMGSWTRGRKLSTKGQSSKLCTQLLFMVSYKQWSITFKFWSTAFGAFIFCWSDVVVPHRERCMSCGAGRAPSYWNESAVFVVKTSAQAWVRVPEGRFVSS